MIEVKETFSTTMVLEDIIVPNTWYVTISLVPNMGKNKLYTKAMDRIQYYIAEVIDNSVFIGAHNLSKIANLPFKAQVHVFPDDPWDHLVAMCLYTKITAICEQVFFVDSITINSQQARNVSHTFTTDEGGNENLLQLFDDEPDLEQYVKYWYKPTPQLFLLHEGLKLVETDWAEEDLTFDEKSGTVIDIKDFKKKPPNNDNDTG